MKKRLIGLLLAGVMLLAAGCTSRVDGGMSAEELYREAAQKAQGDVDYTARIDFSLGAGILTMDIGMDMDVKMQTMEDNARQVFISMAMRTEEETQSTQMTLQDNTVYLEMLGEKYAVKLEDLEAFGLDPEETFDVQLLDPDADLEGTELTLEKTQDGYCIKGDTGNLNDVLNSMDVDTELYTLEELKAEQAIYLNANKDVTSIQLSAEGKMKPKTGEDMDVTLKFSVRSEITVNNPGQPVTVERVDPADYETYRYELQLPQDEETYTSNGVQVTVPEGWTAVPEEENPDSGLAVMLMASDVADTGSNINIVLEEMEEGVTDLSDFLPFLPAILNTVEEELGVPLTVYNEGEIIQVAGEDAIYLAYGVTIEQMELHMIQIIQLKGTHFVTTTGTALAAHADSMQVALEEVVASLTLTE